MRRKKVKVIKVRLKTGLKTYQYDCQRYAAYQRAWYEKTKEAVFGHYGKQCRTCGKKTNLQLDHIKENGKQFRQETGLKGFNFYLWVIKNNYPEDLQTLCGKCNIGKYWKSVRK